VLVVEDEPAVRRMLTRTLRAQGYSVLEAGNGEEALDRMRREAQPVELVVLDVVLPGLNGHELARRITRERPGLPILFVSGFTGEGVDPEDLFEHGPQLLRKPFAPETLARTVRDLLAASHDRASPKLGA
jgi:DNA-binding response OmpR family regulator